MQNVINVFKLYVLLNLGFAYLVGLGWLLVSPILNRSFIKIKRKYSLLYEIPLMMLSGLVINYGLVLLFHSIKISFIVGGILAIIGIGLFSYSHFRQSTTEDTRELIGDKLIGIVFICLLFLGPILAKPLTDWDARSIWFFHGKMIYSAGSFDQFTGWDDPIVSMFSHVDYPNLIPTLAAQVSYLAGFWNEYLPKISLFFILIPAVTLLFSFARRSFSFIILLLLLLFSFYPFMWNGYMDGYFALYFGLSLLLLGEYFRTSQPIDLLSSIFCMMFLLYIKNEGVLAVVSILCVMFLIMIIDNRWWSIKNYIYKNWRNLFICFILILPFVLWNFYKIKWNIGNDLNIGTLESFARLSSRLMSGSIELIFIEILKQLKISLMMLGLGYFTSVMWRKTLPKEIIPAAIAGMIYCLGIVVVYLMTPHDLTWQIKYSVDRTMLAVNGSFYVAIYFIIRILENEDISVNNQGQRDASKDSYRFTKSN